MKWLRKVLMVFLIVLPIGAGAALPLGSENFSYQNASQGAAAARKLGDRKQEIAYLQTLSDFQPWNTEIWSRLGELALDTGDASQAIVYFTRASLLGALEPQAQFEYAKALQSSGKIDQARILYRQISESGVKQSDLLLEVAQAQESINDSIGTLATLLRAKEIAPNAIDINYALGIQFAASQPDNAIQFLQAAAVSSTYQSAANALVQLIQSTSSIKGSVERFIYIGQVLSNLGEWEAAANAFEQAKQADPNNAIAWALHGEAVQHLGESGYDDLTKAVEINPHSDIVNGLMAIYFRRQQKYDLAIKYLYSASESNPHEPTWQIEIGNTLAMQGQLSDALIHFQVATLMDESNWVPWRELATFCVTYNYLVDSVGLNAARKALLLNPGSASLLDLMGSVYMSLADYDSAERFLLQANQAAPNRAEILYHLGQLYLQKGDKQQAFAYLRQAAGITTDERIRENANRLIQSNGGE